MIRFASRYIRASVAGMVRTFLDDFGWTGPNPNFGTQPVALHIGEPAKSDLVATDGNTVFVSFGVEDDHESLELGSGLLGREMVFFIDVVGLETSIAQVIAEDIRDRLTGIRGGTRYLRPTNPATGEELAGYLCEFKEVMLHEPRGDRKNWVTVDGSLAIEFPGEES